MDRAAQEGQEYTPPAEPAPVPESFAECLERDRRAQMQALADEVGAELHRRQEADVRHMADAVERELDARQKGGSQ